MNKLKATEEKTKAGHSKAQNIMKESKATMEAGWSLFSLAGFLQ